jgi:Fe-S-cluster-containing hydrogenase component 2
MSLTPKQRVERIVENALCIGCGLCQAVAGRDKIQVRKGKTGYLVPIVSDDLDAATADLIDDVCPGVHAWACLAILSLQIANTTMSGVRGHVWCVLGLAMSNNVISALQPAC